MNEPEAGQFNTGLVVDGVGAVWGPFYPNQEGQT
jgi:hypothetical protein